MVVWTMGSNLTLLAPLSIHRNTNWRNILSLFLRIYIPKNLLKAMHDQEVSIFPPKMFIQDDWDELIHGKIKCFVASFRL